MYFSVRTPLFFFNILLILFVSFAPAWGADPAEEFLPLGLDSGVEITAPPAISPRPTSRIAENVTTISAKEIDALNAHSLAEVLGTVPGIDIASVRTPGNHTFFSIQGESDSSGNILLLIDGVSQGNLLQGAIDPGLIPVQHIERIEIIKGSASAAWGPALGGVINVVTKMPETDRPFSGTASTSAGERNTTDLLADISGTSQDIGYYLSGGHLYSKGLLPNNGTNRSNLYGKLTYDLPVKGNLSIGGSYVEAKRGIEEVYVPDWDLVVHDNNRDRRYYSFLNFSYPLQPDLTLELAAQDSRLDAQSIWGHLEGSQVVTDNHWVLRENNRGGKLKLIWGDNRQNLTTGIEYLHSKVTQIDKNDPASQFMTDRSRDSLSFYGNSAISFDRLTLLPGIRYDRTGLDQNTFSYTLGATFRLTAKTLVRGYVAKGYSLPKATDNNIPQQIWTVQTGIESEAIPYLWLKGTYFYNHAWNIQDTADDGLVHPKQDRQGFELEVKTVPLYGISFSGGYTFIHTRDAENKQAIKGVPVHLLKAAVNFDNPDWGTKGVFSGNYSDLNMEAYHLAYYNPIVWNLHLTQQLAPGKELSPELFFNINNVFNGSHYWDYWYLNPRRWIEGGVRFRF